VIDKSARPTPFVFTSDDVGQVTPVMKQVTPVMQVAPSINVHGGSAAVVAGAHFAKGHASGRERSATLAESLQRSAIVQLEGIELLTSLSFPLLSRRDVSSQRSKAPCLFALGPSLR
jgi:hypothetical protein